MPNWCSTSITINYEDESKLNDLERIIEDSISKEKNNENGFGPNWLGNVVINLDLGTVDEKLETDLRCRGIITYIDRLESQLIIDTETAWIPMMKMWVKFIDKYLPDAELLFNAVEPNMDVYETNDPYYVNKYVIDTFGLYDKYNTQEADEDYVVKSLQELLNSDKTDIEELLKDIYESDIDVRIHKWKFVDPKDCDY